MFHYIKWRPTSVIKKHSLPSETEFFLNKEGDITPPPKKKRQRNRTKCPNKRGQPDDQLPSYTTPQSASREAPQDDFLVSDVTKDEEIFFQGLQTSPDQEGLTFFWLQTSPRDDSPRSLRRHLRSPFPG